MIHQHDNTTNPGLGIILVIASLVGAFANLENTDLILSIITKVIALGVSLFAAYVNYQIFIINKKKDDKTDESVK